VDSPTPAKIINNEIIGKKKLPLSTDVRKDAAGNIAVASKAKQNKKADTKLISDSDKNQTSDKKEKIFNKVVEGKITKGTS
jgi:hypothetical protein